MEEKSNRKVLISVKVSTLLLILLAIIIISILSKIVISKLSNNDKEILNANKIVETNEVQKNKETNENVTKKMVSSRSAVSRIDSNLESLETVEMFVKPVEETAPIEEKTTPIEEVTISKDMDLTIRTGLSRDDFILLISNVKQDTSNFFEDNAGLIYDLCEKYELNEIFFCGLISAESGWNIATNHRNTHNYISLMSSKGLIKYSSVEEGLEKAAEVLHNNYLTPGGCFYYGKTLADMKTKFCPASSTWVNLVYQRMLQVLN